MSGKVYVFVGRGEGVPGLPHEISEAEAKELGVSELLAAGIQNGNYREKTAGKDVKRGAEPKTEMEA